MGRLQERELYSRRKAALGLAKGKLNQQPHRRCGCASPMQLLMHELVHQRKLANTSLKHQNNETGKGILITSSEKVVIE
eukprot:5621179-Pleurochrysis_carterae.AAC.1